MLVDLRIFTIAHGPTCHESKQRVPNDFLRVDRKGESWTPRAALVVAGVPREERFGVALRDRISEHVVFFFFG